VPDGVSAFTAPSGEQALSANHTINATIVFAQCNMIQFIDKCRDYTRQSRAATRSPFCHRCQVDNISIGLRTCGIGQPGCCKRLTATCRRWHMHFSIVAHPAPWRTKQKCEMNQIGEIVHA